MYPKLTKLWLSLVGFDVSIRITFSLFPVSILCKSFEIVVTKANRWCCTTCINKLILCKQPLQSQHNLFKMPIARSTEMPETNNEICHHILQCLNGNGFRCPTDERFKFIQHGRIVEIECLWWAPQTEDKYLSDLTLCDFCLWGSSKKDTCYFYAHN